MSTPGGLVDKQELINAQLDTAHLGRVVNSKDASGNPITESTNRTGGKNRTLDALEADYNQSIATKEAEADAAIDEFRLTNKGQYAAGIMLASKLEYLTYNGESYFAVTPPYTTTATTPDADTNLFIGGYTTIEAAAQVFSNENLIPNASFEVAGSVANPPDSTPRSYSAGDELFSGFKAVGALSGVTYVNGKLNGTGQLYVDVYKTEKQKLSTAPHVASIALSDGVPVESGASFVDSGDYWRVTFDMNDTFSVKLEQGSVATRHEVGISLLEFSTVEQMKASADISRIEFSDIICDTTSYYGGWASQLVPYGGARYLLTKLQRVRDTLGDPTWVPDGFGDHYLFGGTTYVAKIVVDGFTNVDSYGAKPNDESFDSTPSFLAASVAARALSGGTDLGNNNINPRPYVRFTPGVVYYQYSTVALDVEAVRIDFRCEGVAVISGANPSTPSSRNPLGWSFNQIYRTTFSGLSFAGFDKIHEWDTNNTDNATVVYSDCDFLDSGNPGVPVIDTRSFAESRSTDLVFNNCRCQFVPMLLDSYCDTLRFEGGRYKNYDPNGCLIQADSLVTTEGGMFVPEALGDEARFFDLYDNGVTGTRGFNSNGTRFSPEGGGIPVVYNFMDGQNSATNHLTNFIMFYGGANSASSGTLDGALVVLQDDGVNSIAPSIIGFYGASVRSNSGLVRTENGLPVGKVKGRFAIEVSEACQSHLTDINTPVSFPLVEDILRPYLVGSELYNEPTTLTNTGNFSIDLLSVNAGPQPIIQFQNSGVTVDAISNAFDGQIVTIEFVGNSNTVVDFSNGSRIFLSGGVDFTGNAFSTITLRWHRAGDKWYEIGRSSR